MFDKIPSHIYDQDQQGNVNIIIWLYWCPKFSNWFSFSVHYHFVLVIFYYHFISNLQCKFQIQMQHQQNVRFCYLFDSFIYLLTYGYKLVLLFQVENQMHGKVFSFHNIVYDYNYHSHFMFFLNCCSIVHY